MSSGDKSNKNNDDAIMRDIISGQKFSLSGAIGRKAGDLIKGASPIPKLDQVIAGLNQFINDNLHDPSCALREFLHVIVKEDGVKICRHIDDPLVYLEEKLLVYLNNENILHELVHDVDFKWGQMLGERPHFQKPGEPPDREDEYTYESVREQLKDLLAKI